jgi:membrane protease subunit HflK
MRRRVIEVGGERIEIPEFDTRWLVYGVIAVLGIWLIFSMLYTVDADEVGVIQRFGKYVRTTDPGLNWKLPFGFETVKKVTVQRVLKEEFGFRTITAGVQTQYSQADFSEQSLMLTGDLNSAVVEWVVQYRVKDPVKFLFNVRNTRETIRQVSEAVMRQVVGDRSVDEVIILNRKEVALKTQELMQELLDRYGTGVDIVTVNLQDVNPPVPVQPAFNEVNEAMQAKERIINEAWEAYNQVIPRAKGEAEQTIRQAEGYATNRINRAKGDAEKFVEVWRAYAKARDVTRRRLYLEAMMEILPRFENVYIIDEGQKSFLPLLQLQQQKREVKK